MTHDITHCTGENCFEKGNCYRYTQYVKTQDPEYVKRNGVYQIIIFDVPPFEIEVIDNYQDCEFKMVVNE